MCDVRSDILCPSSRDGEGACRCRCRWVSVCPLPRHELIMQPMTSPPHLCVSSSFLVYPEQRLRRCVRCTAVDPVWLMQNRMGTSGDDSFIIPR